MVSRSLRQACLALMTASVMAGCGAVQSNALPNTARTSAVGAQAASSLKELIPTAAQLAELERMSPDQLIENAPEEPGLAFHIGPQPPKEDLGNFAKVEDTLWRGARPTEKGMDQLKTMGVKTIVNFENDKKVVEKEKAMAEARGIKFVSIPLSVITPPKMKNVDQFLSIANDPANRPLYFHCMQGRDRTGTAAFAYRITHDKWDYKRAYAEMKSYHFHTYLLGLQAFLVYFAKERSEKAGAPALAPAL